MGPHWDLGSLSSFCLASRWPCCIPSSSLVVKVLVLQRNTLFIRTRAALHHQPNNTDTVRSNVALGEILTQISLPLSEGLRLPLPGHVEA